MQLRLSFLLAAFAALLLVPANAQPSSNVRDSRGDLLDALNRETTQTSAEEDALIEDGGDLAALTRLERALRTRLAVVNDFVYQSNAELSGNGGEGDFVWFPAIVGGLTYKLSDRLTLEAQAALQAGFYADLQEFDYWGISGQTLVRRELAAGWSLYGGALAYDYQSLRGNGTLVRAFAPTVGFGYSRYYAASRTFAFADIGVKKHFTSPSADDRAEYAASLGVSRQLADRLHIQAIYAYRFADYDNGRHDQRHQIGASLIYLFNDTIRASLGVNFVDNDSNAFGADYQTVNTGLGSSLSWSF